MKFKTYLKRYIQQTNNYEFLNNKYFIFYIKSKKEIYLIENILNNNKIYFKILNIIKNKKCKTNIDIINNFFIFKQPNDNLEYEEILTNKINNIQLLLIFEYGKLIGTNIDIIKYNKQKNKNICDFNLNLIRDILNEKI